MSDVPSVQEQAAYRAKVKAEYERIGPPEGSTYFGGWRLFLNQEEDAGRHPQWFWDGFIKTGDPINPDGSWRIEEEAI